MAKSVRSGKIKGRKWSETDNRGDLYDLARELELDGLTSRLRKDEIVALLVKASAKKPAKKASKAKRTQKPAAAVPPAPSSTKPTAPEPKVALAASRKPKRKVGKKPARPKPRTSGRPNMPTGGARKVR